MPRISQYKSTTPLPIPETKKQEVAKESFYLKLLSSKYNTLKLLQPGIKIVARAIKKSCPDIFKKVYKWGTKQVIKKEEEKEFYKQAKKAKKKKPEAENKKKVKSKSDTSSTKKK